MISEHFFPNFRCFGLNMVVIEKTYNVGTALHEWFNKVCPDAIMPLLSIRAPIQYKDDIFPV